MWLLQHEGDLFNGKTLWLPPGRSYLFGRTSSRGAQSRPIAGVFHIQEKSVSRQHLVIDVVRPADNEKTEPWSQSKLFITDNSSKGTFLDGKEVKNGEQTLVTGSRHTVKLGNWPSKLVLTWENICFTWKPSSKQLKDGYEETVRKFRQIDIKIMPEYAVSATSHVITEKRNVPAGLQALINAKYMVTNQYLDAVWAAAQSDEISEDEETPRPSQLEQDFGGHWPDPMQYVPPPGKEPMPRPSELFRPDPDRLEIFKGFTFVFADQKQFDTLMAPLTNGHGKAVLKQVQLGQTPVTEYARIVRDLAEWKGIRPGRFECGKYAGVTVVRFRGVGDMEDWATGFLRELDRELGQRSAEQNEFLDAIIMKDTQKLRQPLHLEEAIDIEPDSKAPGSGTQLRVDPETGNAESLQMHNDLSESPGERKRPSARTRRAARSVTKTKLNFDDFDDDFVPKHSTSPQPENAIDSQQAPDSAQPELTARGPSNHNQEDASQDMFISDSPPPTNPRKRKVPTESSRNLEEEDLAARDAHLDRLLPGAVAMKKRRVAQEAAGIRQPTPQIAAQAKPKAVAKKEVDVRTAVRQHAQAIDRQHLKSGRVDFKADGEHGAVVQDSLQIDEDVSKLRDLCIIEDMPVREPRSVQDQDRAHDARWKPEWEGRKNFKRFRRSDARGLSERRTNKVIVPLVEAKKKSNMADDDYFLRDESTQPQQQRAIASRASETQNQSQARTERGRRLLAGDTDHDESDDGVAWDDMTEQPGDARPGSNASRKKRTAAIDTAEEPPSKKTRQSRLRKDDDDDDSDGDDMKFRFRRRRK